jgi:catechol 2,3-dioxygenase
MPLPTHIFNPPFNVVRCSHTVLTSRDLGASRAFYEDAIGLHVEEASKDAIYFRGMEERNHHSLILKKGNEPVAEQIGFKVGSEEDLDRAAAFFKERQLPAKFVEVPHQGRTLHVTDTQGNPLEL